MTPRGPVAIAALALAASLMAHAPAGEAAGPPTRPWQPPAAPKRSYLPDSTVLARFEGTPIRAIAVMSRFYDVLPTERPDADSSGRAQYVHTMVDQLVLGRLARKANVPLGFEDRAKIREYEQRALSNRLFQRYVEDSVVVDTSLVRVLYEQMGTQRQFRWMLFADRATAEHARAAILRKTMTWEQAYTRYHRGIQRPDLGDVGWLDRLSNGGRFPAEAYRLKPGELSSIWSDIGGWNLVLCMDRRTIRHPVYRVVEARLETIAHQTAVSERSDHLLAILRARAHVTYDTANVVWVAERFTIADLEGGPRGTIRITHRVPIFAPQDTGRVLARYDGGVLSLDGFMHAYTELPPVARPVVDTPERLRRQVDVTVLEPQRAELARALGYEKDPEVIAALDKFRESLMVDHLYADSVEAHVEVTDAMRRRYYEENLPKFVTYAQVQFGIMIADRRSEADSLAARIKGGEKIADILLADSLAHRPKRGSVRWMSQTEEGAPLYPLLFNEMKPGDVVVQGPDQDGVYEVIQETRFDGGHQLSYEESANMADAAVQNLEAERLLNAFIARHRREFRIEEHPELVMRVNWRDPTMDKPTPGAGD